MRVLRGMITAGIAQRLIAEARKPANQAKARQVLTQVQSRAKRTPR